MRQNPRAWPPSADRAPNGFAGLFVGRVRVTGQLSKGGGGLTIDHPTDPENPYLSHSFVESPDMFNVYSGNVTTSKDGTARVRLPSYFEPLNTDFRYQLTVIGDFARAVVAEEIKDNAFTIRTDSGRVKVSWQVTGSDRTRGHRPTGLNPNRRSRKRSGASTCTQNCSARRRSVSIRPRGSVG